MNYIFPKQSTYNSKLWQNDFISNKTDPKIYLTRLVSLINRVYYKNYDVNEFYNIILRGFYLNFEKNNNDISINISPGVIIIDSVLFDIPNQIDLTTNTTLLDSVDSLFVVFKYEYKDTGEYNPLKIELFLYNTLKGIVYPNTWDHNAHYVFLAIYSIDENNNISFYSVPDIPDCKTEIIDPVDPIIPPEIDYNHQHVFSHDHTHENDHIHEDILIELTEIGGAIFPEIEPEIPQLEDNRPLCSDFLDYTETDITNIIIGDIEYSYVKPKKYLDEYMKLFYLHLSDYALQYHLRGLQVPSINDIFNYNTISIHSLYKNQKMNLDYG